MPLNDSASRNVQLHMDIPQQLVKSEGVSVRRLPSEYQMATFMNLTKSEEEEFAKLEEYIWEGSVLVGGEEVSVRYRQAPSLMVTVGNVCAEGCFSNEEGKCLVGAAAEKEEKEEKEEKGEEKEAAEEAKQEQPSEQQDAKEDYPDPETSSCSLCYHSREGPCKDFFISALPDILASKATRATTLFTSCMSGYPYYDTSPGSVGSMFGQYEDVELEQQ